MTNEHPATLTGRERSLVERELSPGETVLWCGVPDQQRRSRGMIAVIIVAAAMGFLVSPVFRPDAPLVVWLFMIAWYVALAIAVVAAVVQSLPSSRPVYVVTDRRAIIIRGALRKTARSFEPQHLTDARLEARQGGLSDVILATTVSTAKGHDPRRKVGPPLPRRHARIVGFLGIAEGEAALTAIDDLLARHGLRRGDDSIQEN